MGRAGIRGGRPPGAPPAASPDAQMEEAGVMAELPLPLPHYITACLLLQPQALSEGVHSCVLPHSGGSHSDSQLAPWQRYRALG